MDDWIRTAAPSSEAAAAAAAAAARAPSCGSPRPPVSGIPETFKATDEDALRQWIDPIYAEARKSEVFVENIRRELGKLAVEDRMRLLTMQPPEPARQWGAVGAVAIPVAKAVHEAASITPIVSELVSGAEAITGRGLFGLGEKLSDEERVLSAVFAAALVAGPIIESGARGARVVLQVVRASGRSAEEVLTALKVSRTLARDEAVLREALALRKANRPLQPRHEAALRRAGAALEEIRGAAKHSRFDPSGDVRRMMSNAEKAALPPFAPNAGGVSRSAEEAIAIARKEGVHVPEWVKIVSDPSVPGDRFADYTLVRPGDLAAERGRVTWRAISRGEVIVVRVHPSVLKSDEAIAAVLEHECFELTRLKRTLETRGAVSPAELQRMISADVPNNLHHQAWEMGDYRLLAMRATDPAERQEILGRMAQYEQRTNLMNFGKAGR
jgi:hypothetical protein